MLPAADIASGEIRDERGVIRHRVALTQLRTSLKNRVHAVIAAHGGRLVYHDLFGPGGRRELASLPVRPPARRRIASYLRLIDQLDAEITTTRKPGPLADMHTRIRQRRGTNIVTVAVARRILELAYYALRDGEIRCLQTPQANAA
jgi:transposase